MKARYVGKCLFCTPCARAIKVGDEVVRHPTYPENENGTINWVHARHVKLGNSLNLLQKMIAACPKEEAKPISPLRLINNLKKEDRPDAFTLDNQHMRRDWGDF